MALRDTTTNFLLKVGMIPDHVSVDIELMTVNLHYLIKPIECVKVIIAIAIATSLPDVLNLLAGDATPVVP